MVRDSFICFVFITSLHKKYVIKINLLVLRLMGNKLLTYRNQLILLTLRVIKRSWLHFLIAIYADFESTIIPREVQHKDETMSHVYETQKHKIDSYGNKVICG